MAVMLVFSYIFFFLDASWPLNWTTEFNHVAKLQTHTDFFTALMLPLILMNNCNSVLIFTLIHKSLDCLGGETVLTITQNDVHCSFSTKVHIKIKQDF